VDQLADHTDRPQPGQAGQIHRRLRVARTPQHPTGLGAQRHHVPRPRQVRRGGGRIGEQPNGVRAVRGGDASGDPLARVDRHRVSRAPPVLVHVVHRRQLEPIRVLLGERHADEPGGVADHEREQLGRGHLGGEDQIALVLPVLVVDDDHRPPRGDVRDRLFDSLECVHAVPPVGRPPTTPGLDGRDAARVHQRSPAAGCAAASRRSTYLAMTSTSTLTRASASFRPSVVSARVVGIRCTVNDGVGSSATDTTVIDTPSTAIEPLGTTYRDSSLGSPIRTSCQRSVGKRERITPTPSTCPCTTCPPSRVASVAARSRFTGSPGATLPSVVRSRVSFITSTVKVSPVVSTTVRQTPLTAIESPCWASAATFGPRTVNTAESPRQSRRTASPSSSMMPVNMRLALSLSG